MADFQVDFMALEETYPRGDVATGEGFVEIDDAYCSCIGKPCTGCIPWSDYPERACSNLLAKNCKTPNAVINLKMQWQSRKLRKVCARCYKFWTRQNRATMYEEYNSFKAKEEAEGDGVVDASTIAGRGSVGEGDGALQEQVETLVAKVEELTMKVDGALQEQVDILVAKVEELQIKVQDLQSQISHGQAGLHVRVLALEENASSSSYWPARW